MHLVQSNLDIKFRDVDSKSELLRCFDVCVWVGLSEHPSINKAFTLQSVLKSRISFREMSLALLKPLPHT